MAAREDADRYALSAGRARATARDLPDRERSAPRPDVPEVITLYRPGSCARSRLGALGRHESIRYYLARPENIHMPGRPDRRRKSASRPARTLPDLKRYAISPGLFIGGMTERRAGAEGS
jgi:hypothetical protein